MRGALLLCMTFALAGLSGCAELVEDPQVQQAVEEASGQVDEAQAQVQDLPGHIAGTVVGTDGSPIAGAQVALDGLDAADVTDARGGFAFVDLPAGAYVLLASADGFLNGSAAQQVEPGLFARPQLVLEAIPAPEPYSEVNRFDGYSDLGVFGSGFLGCHCSFGVDLAEGLHTVVIEAVKRDSSGTFNGYGFSYTLYAYDEEGYYVTGESGSGPSPLHVILPGESFEGATAAHVEVSPDAWLDLGTEYTVFVSEFYHDGPPEGFTALTLK